MGTSIIIAGNSNAQGHFGKKPPYAYRMGRFKSHNFVRMKGLEPPRLTAPDPKSGAATNYATSAS